MWQILHSYNFSFKAEILITLCVDRVLSVVLKAQGNHGQQKLHRVF